MIGALWNGVSGVITQTKGINVEANNSTNVNTIGHKSDSITFEDLMYQGGYGQGVTSQEVRKNFDQGNLKITNVGLDAAIEGNGFFILNEDGTGNSYYTRAGNFRMHEDGTLRTQFDERVQGVPSLVAGVVSTDGSTQFESQHTEFMSSQVLNSDVFLQSFNAKATNYNESATTNGVSGTNYKEKGALVSDIELLKVEYQNKLELFASTPNAAATSSIAQETTINYGNFLTQLKDGNDFVEVTIGNTTIKQKFDTDTQTTMNLFSDQISKIQGITSSVDTNGLVTINSLIPGKDVKISGAALNEQAPTTINTIESVLGTGQGMVDSARDALISALGRGNAEFIEIHNTISYASEQSLNVADLQMKMDVLGLSSDRFGTLEIDEGIIFSTQGDNKFVIGKLGIANFTDRGALDPEGGNKYSATNGSGDPRFAPDANNITGGSLELSNTDLSKELTELLVYQKAFEASSKSITTADEFLNIAIQLKK